MVDTEVIPQSMPAQGAGFWIRAAARILDILLGYLLGYIGGILGALILFFLQGAGVVAEGWAERLPGHDGLFMLMSLLGGLVYHVLAEGLHGATLGKFMCRIVVLNENGSISTIKGALIRNLAWYIDSLFIGLVAYSSMRESPLNQRYGDVWGKTVVMHTKDISPEQPRSIKDFLLANMLGIICWIALNIAGVIMAAS